MLGNSEIRLQITRPLKQSISRIKYNLSDPPRENLKMGRTGSEEFGPGMLCINLVYPKGVWDYGEIDGK